MNGPVQKSIIFIIIIIIIGNSRLRTVTFDSHHYEKQTILSEIRR